MDFGISEREGKLRTEVRDALAEPAVRDALQALRAGGEREPDVRPLYRELGRRGLLAVSWPVEYGGRGATHAEATAVVEELVLGAVPDMLQVLSVQIVGLFILQAGSDEQKQRYLPALASGRLFATVLYTEPESGSDLASLRTRADRSGGGYLLSGVKVYGLKSGLSDLALCAARTSESANRYEGLSLFLVDLNAEQIERSHIASIADEQFDRVELTQARVGADALLGAEGEGWALLTRCLAIERTGVDYSLKAARWYEATLAGVDPTDVDDGLLEEIGRNGAAVTAGRLLAWDVIGRLDRGVVDPVAAAISKFHTSETAQAVAAWAALVHGFGYRSRALDATDAGLLEAAYREAPGLSLSAGTSQIMLELIANSTFHRAEPNRD
jgi:alkylation response protein AidB-like acyl-CoA dehydrogenase